MERIPIDFNSADQSGKGGAIQRLTLNVGPPQDEIVGIVKLANERDGSRRRRLCEKNRISASQGPLDDSGQHSGGKIHKSPFLQLSSKR